MKKINPSVLIYISALLFGIIIWFATETIFKSYNPSPGLGFILFVLSVVVSALIDIRASQEEIKKQMAFDQVLYKDRWLLRQLEPIIKDYTNVVRQYKIGNEGYASTPYFVAQKNIEQCKKNLADLADGNWNISSNAQRMELLIEVMQSARFSIKAATGRDFSSWWDSPHGELYLRENIQKAPKLKMERVFIVKGNVLNLKSADKNKDALENARKLYEIVKKHQDANAYIYIAIEEELKEKISKEIRNILICDNSFVAWSYIGVDDGGKASLNKNDIDRYTERFDNIRHLSRPPQEYSFYKLLEKMQKNLPQS
jgi:hypothetical protein